MRTSSTSTQWLPVAAGNDPVALRLRRLDDATSGYLLGWLGRDAPVPREGSGANSTSPIHLACTPADLVPAIYLAYLRSQHPWRGKPLARLTGSSIGTRDGG